MPQCSVVISLRLSDLRPTLNASPFQLLRQSPTPPGMSDLPFCGLDVPDALAVVTNRSVRGKFSHPGGVQNGRARPSALIAPERAHFFLRIDVRLIIRQKEIGIVD